MALNRHSDVTYLAKESVLVVAARFASCALSAALLLLLGTCRLLAEKTNDLALLHITIVDVVTGSTESDMTVVVSGSMIEAVGPSKSVRVSTRARIINARGAYLIPGLWDMHVHSDGDRAALESMLAAGITGARDMGGDLTKLVEARHELAAGNWNGPKLVIAGPLFQGPPGQSDADSWILATPAEARKAVASLAASHVDFIKVHDRLSRDVYFAIADASKAAHLPFAGHVPESIAPVEASDAGQLSIEHFEYLPKNCVRLLDKLAADETDLPHDCSRMSIDALLKHLAENGTWIDPTIQSFRYWEPTQWSRTFADFSAITRMIRIQHVALLAGTDWGVYLQNRGALPGWCLHDELELLVKAGFTPLEALRAATLNPAIFFGAGDSLGSISAGKIADLVIIGGNPLVNMKAARNIIAVIHRGVYLDRTSLRALGMHATLRSTKN